MVTREKPRQEITLTRLVATALAAITAAFLGSRLGTAGTVIGAGVASMVSTVAGALYQHSLDRTSNRVRSRVLQTRGESVPDTDSDDVPPAEAASRRFGWRTATAVTVAAFVLGMGAITGYELLTHGPISGGGNGTTISNLLGRQPSHQGPATPQPVVPASVTTTTQAPPTTNPTPTTGPTTTTPPSTTTTTAPSSATSITATTSQPPP